MFKELKSSIVFFIELAFFSIDLAFSLSFQKPSSCDFFSRSLASDSSLPISKIPPELIKTDF